MVGAKTGSKAAQVLLMPLTELHEAPYNPRKIDAAALKGLTASVKRFGLVEPLVWNKRTNRLVGGHQRLKVLKAEKAVNAQVVVVDLPETEEKALNVVLNNPHVAGEFSDDLGPLLAQLNAALPPGVFEDLRLDELMEPVPLEEDEVPEPPKVAVTKPGDLWTLGRHRLLCGDATKAEDVAGAMGVGRPFLMVTDPPYGVDYDPNWRNEEAAKGNLAYAPSRVGLVPNDDRIDWSAAWSLFHGDVAYVWHADRHASETQRSLEACGLEIRCQVIWSKSNFRISRGHYHWRHEPCWYAVRTAATARWIGDRKQTTVWEVNLDTNVDGGHSTQKPVECMARPIRNHDTPEVYDPFLGSGTTLIAAEQLDRTCYGLEIEPRYCDVIVERWQNLTGKKATRG